MDRRSLIIAALLLAAALPAHADDGTDDYDYAAEQAQYLAQAAAQYRSGDYKGLPMFTAQVSEELPTLEEYAERWGWCSYENCCAPLIDVNASSALPDAKENSYSAAMLDDYLLQTAWVEGVDGPGTGQTVSFHFETADGDPSWDRQYINGLEFVNGYVKSEALFRANACPHIVRLWFDGEPICYLRWLDSMDIQTVQFEPVHLSTDRDHDLLLEIIEVRPGTKYEDTAITEIQLLGGPCH